jgi:predicted RNA-binding Zn ribbon-like protein
VNFNSHLDTMVGVAVGLVNVATPGYREGRSYQVPGDATLVDALATRLQTGRKVRSLRSADTGPLCAAAAQLREAVVAVDRGDHDSAAAILNDILLSTGTRPHLERHDGEPWHLHFHGRDGDLIGGWVGSCATALAVVLGSEYADRLGVCSAQSCDRVFVDTSRNGTRRFCGLACQSRMKTAAYRARTTTPSAAR